MWIQALIIEQIHPFSDYSGAGYCFNFGCSVTLGNSHILYVA